MKFKNTLLALLFLLPFANWLLPTGFSQGNWYKKADFGGTERCWAAGFSIGSKGYIGTGWAYNWTAAQDFWEFDQASNTWTQKADFPGIPRNNMTSFSIGTKGYMGLGVIGNTTTCFKDFWEYDPNNNLWTQKADFVGALRYRAAGFSIGNKGYIGTGYDGNTVYQDFWEYDPILDSWVQKANCGGGPRQFAVGFAIGNKGYIGTGHDGNSPLKDFWEWDQTNNSWAQKASLGGTAKYDAVGFALGNKGYIGTGHDGTSYLKDFWEWDQASNTWIQKANVGGSIRHGAVGFSIGNSGYIGTGGWVYNDFWEWYSLTLSASVTHVSCLGNNDGIANAQVTGGAAPYTYIWSNNGSTNPVSGLAPGSYSVTVTDATGYALTTTFTVTQPTALSVSHTSVNSGCDNVSGSASLSVSGGTTPYSYLWSNGHTTKNISGIGAGSYSVTVTDNHGCTKSDTISIQNSISQNPMSICMVTVDSTNKNVVVWEKPSSPLPIDSFRIYREIASTYKHIGSVAYSAFSTYTDVTSGVNPKIAAYKYEISVIDTCGNESSLSSYHKTIHMAMGPASPCGYNLIWNDYIGFPITQYLIHRDSAKTGWKLVDSLSFGNTSWTDATCYPVGDTIAYFIEALNPAGCNPSIKNPELMAITSTRSNTQQNLGSSSVTEFPYLLDINVFPNPSNGSFTIEWDNAQISKCNLKIFNLVGEKIHEETVDSQFKRLDLDLSDGLYFIEIKSETGSAVHKIIIQK